MIDKNGDKKHYWLLVISDLVKVEVYDPKLVYFLLQQEISLPVVVSFCGIVYNVDRYNTSLCSYV